MKLPFSLLLATTMAASMTAVAPAPASEIQDQYLAKLAQCINLLLTDPIEQARVCGTGNGPSGRTLPDYTPPPPPPPKELCPEVNLFAEVGPDCEPRGS